MIKKIILCIFPLLFFSACSKTEIKFVSNPTVELGSKTDACDFISSYKNKTAKTKGTSYIYVDDTKITCSELDTSQIGYTKAYYNVDGQMYSLTIKVKDTTPPEIFFLDNISSDNPLDYVKATDLSGVQSLTFEGTYNPNVAGEYTLTIIASDNEGNTSTKDLVLTVNEGAKQEQEKNQ